MTHTVRRRDVHTSHKRGRVAGAEVMVERRARRRRSAPKRQVEHHVITDHAIIRWLERVVGVDVRAKVEAEILADGRGALIASIGTGRIRLAGTRIALVVKEGVVVTIAIEERQHG